MSTPVSKLYNREFRRHRYVLGEGWVVSNETFMARAQPKFNDSLGKTRPPDQVDAFLNTIVYRDNDASIGSYVDTSYEMKSVAEATALAQCGTDLYIGDRIFEEDSSYGLAVRGSSQFRDGFNMKHDEVTCSELSQLDKKWIEPVTICSVTEEVTGMYYDPVRRQFTKITSDDQNEVEAFGVIESFDTQRFDRDAKVIDRTSVGKELNDRMILTIDAGFPVSENVTIKLRGKEWKIEFIRDNLTRILVVGLRVWKQFGASGDEVRDRAGHLT
jgi:hypothetical protein